MSSKRNKRNRNRSVSKPNQNSVYVQAYTESDYQRDERNFNSAIKTGNVHWDEFKRLMMRDLCLNTSILDTSSIEGVRLEDARLAIEHPSKNWRILVSISEKLMRVSPHYFRLNTLYSNMALFCWGIDIYNVNENVNKATLKKNYLNLAAKLESMNLKHEFSKIMKVLPYQDVFCGVLMEDETDFFIQQIKLSICKIYQIQDGIYNFAIDLAKIKPHTLDAYPDYVQQAYLDFIDGKIHHWYVPPADKQICIKMNSQWIYPYPLLIALIQDLLDLDVYKKLKLQSARTDNYKAIMIKVPIDPTTVDKPLLTPETLGIFAQINRESMSDDIGLIHILGDDGEAISFKDSSNTRNNVADSVNNIYDGSGITKELFNGSSSGTAVTLSVENDAGFVYGVYRQMERWTNRFIKLRKYNKKAFQFHFYLLDMTIFNRDNVSKRYKDAVSMGVTVIDKWMATLDMTPSTMMGSFVLHEDVFDYHNHFKPLETSYNSSAVSSTDGTPGRPTNESNGELLTESGEKTKDSDANQDR